MANNDTTKAFDIIIIGAGTAGCVLANRLSEDPSISILLLEAGEDRNKDELVYTPGLAVELQNNDDYDWQYVTEPQLGINGRRMKHPRGRMLGGTSAINSFALIYPSAAGMDAWADLGNEGWDWEGTKKYFRKFQTVFPANESVERDLKVVSKPEDVVGPIQASLPLKPMPFMRDWCEAFRNLGLENTKDPLEGDAIGGYVSTNHISNDRRERSHAGVAYFEPIRHRSNVSLVTAARVEKIVFERIPAKNAVATGVAYTIGDTTHFAKAGKEVLLAAGVFETPSILERSGIGNSAVLEQHGIDIVYHNPNVGENLQDHPRSGVAYEIAPGMEFRDAMPDGEARKIYQDNRSGPWAQRAAYSFAYLPLVPFLSSAEQQDLSKLLDQHLSDPTLSEFEQKRNTFIENMILSPSEATVTAYLAGKPPISDPESRNWCSLFGMLSLPFSTGSVHITSPDPTAIPKIDFRHYTHPLDMEIHARHVQSLVKIAKTALLSKYTKAGGAQSPVKFDDLTVEEAKDLVRAHSMTNYHPCGTCSMMAERLGGVVDSHLRVYGTTNVRVVDASIMPIIPRGNIISTVYAVAEKAADLVSGDLDVKRVTQMRCRYRDMAIDSTRQLPLPFVCSDIRAE